MTWHDDKYIRTLLDGREKWGTVLSLTAVAGSLVFLAEHPHRPWLAFAPLLLGLIGSAYVTVVNCYYKQAEVIAEARGRSDESAVEVVNRRRALTFVPRIGLLGWMNNVAPTALGLLATLALLVGLESGCKR